MVTEGRSCGTSMHIMCKIVSSGVTKSSQRNKPIRLHDINNDKQVDTTNKRGLVLLQRVSMWDHCVTHF